MKITFDKKADAMYTYLQTKKVNAMKHNCDLCLKPVKETGRLTPYNINNRVIWLCVECNAKRNLMVT